MRLIDADKLNGIKFHPLPYTHIVPNYVNAESYERGWNDAVDAIIENAPTIEPERKTGEWIITCEFEDCYYAKCNQCNTTQVFYGNKSLTNFCPDCGCDMRGESDALN